jgi:acetyl-CoA/propionyl-CoA carboxylase, biotin carboxylase, biotin carboxyl carrier protein
MKKILIANRGEIAVRIAQACEDRGFESVAVYADADVDAVHVSAATEAYALRGDSPADTYLNIEKLIKIAARSGADSVHPGYGFLSENADFAQTVIDAGLTWIGPSPQAIRSLGNKLTARKIAIQVGAPLVAGSDRPVTSAAEVREFAEENHLPLAIKAVFGGGGRGMKVVRELDAIEEAFDSAVRESRAAFGRGECYVECFLDKPRHVEAQILADTHGHVVVVGTRDCSLQRRNQKLVEEAPAPFLTEVQLERIYSSAKAICRAAQYEGAGTVEYLLATDGSVSFLEVNTRLQVEHGITEETSGVDIVQEQFAIAEGRSLSIVEDPPARGHAFEFRINAEDVGRGFLPSPGTVGTFTTPTGAGIRVDTGVGSGSIVPAQFDSLLAKLIVTGIDRQQALRRARRALAGFRITGLATVLPFHRAIVQAPEFTSAHSLGVYTGWIEAEFAETLGTDPQFSRGAPTAPRTVISIEVDGRRMALGLPARLAADLLTSGSRQTNSPADGQGTGLYDTNQIDEATPGDNELRSGMAGSVVKWLVGPGARVCNGDPVVVLEAMKMETTVAAHRDGILSAPLVAGGESIAANAPLATID